MNRTKPESSLFRHSTFRYIVSGSFFTFIGPALFWFAYGLVGPLVSIVGVEILVHCLRYNVYKRFVFLYEMGFRVNKRRYLASNLPLVLLNVVLIRLFEGNVGRDGLTLLIALTSVLVGYVINHWMYRTSHG